MRHDTSLCVCCWAWGYFLLLVFDFSPSSKNVAAAFFSPACGSVLLLLLFPLCYSSRLGTLSSPVFLLLKLLMLLNVNDNGDFLLFKLACFYLFLLVLFHFNKNWLHFLYFIFLLILCFFFFFFSPFLLFSFFSSLPFLYLDTHPPSPFSPFAFFTKPSSPSSEKLQKRTEARPGCCSI